MDNKLYLGVARRIITPALGCHLYGYPQKPIADGVHDDLTATAYYFTYNDTKLLLIVATIGDINTNSCNELRTALSQKHDIPFGNITIATTHTHTGPNYSEGGHSEWGSFDTENYEKTFLPGIFGATEEAINDVEPVTMAWAQGLSKVGINRRELTKENLATLGECEWGVYDPKMTLLSFKSEKKVKATLVAYGAHGTSAGADTRISRDWSGIMIDAVEAKTGAFCDLLLGAEGDVAPRKIFPDENSSMKQTEALGKVAAEDALKILENLSDYENVSMAAAHATIKIPLQSRPPYDELCAKIESADVENLLLMQRVEHEHNKKMKESYENGYEEKEFAEMPQSIFRIGNFAFAAFPYELFSEIGLRINDYTEDLNVLTIVCTNGIEGYFPTQKELCHGGYEITMFQNTQIQRYVDDADYHLIMETVKNINNLVK